MSSDQDYGSVFGGDAAPPIRQSGLGIASFIVSLVAAGLMFVLILVAGVIEATTPGGMSSKSPAAIVTGMFVILFTLMSLVALGLGIAGLLRKNRKKVFAVLGTIFSAVTILGTLALEVVGLTV